MRDDVEHRSSGSFHGFDSPVEALKFYYEHVLNGRHPEGYEYNMQK